MKKIINKNMSEQLFQALFGTIAVKIPLNKAGTFAAPIRATAKVVESLLKFANKRSFNLFVFVSAVVLNAAVVSEAFSCTVESNGGLRCNNTYYADGNWTCDTATATCTGYGGMKVTYDPTSRNKTRQTYTNSDGSVVAETFDPNTGRETSYANTDANGYTRTTTYDGNGISDSNITGRTLTDSNGKPVNGTVTSGKYTYTAVNGVYTGYTSTNSDDSSEAYTYDPNTGRQTSYASTDANGYTGTTTYDGKGTSNSNITGRTLTDSNGKPVNGTVTSGEYTYMAKNGVYIGYTKTNSNGSGYGYTYDPDTGKKTSYTFTSSDGSSGAYTYDPNTGKMTSCTKTNSDDSSEADTYDPNTGRRTSSASTDANGYTRKTTYDGKGTSDSNITGRTLTDSNGKPVNGTVTSGGYTYMAENGVLTGYTKTNSDGSSDAYTYDPDTGYTTSYKQTNSNGSGAAYTYGPNGRKTSETHTNSDGSGIAYTYDPNTGKMTRRTYCSSYASDGSCSGTSSVNTYDSTTGRKTSETRTNSDGSGSVYTYDPNTGNTTSEAITYSNGNTEIRSYDANGRYIGTSYTEADGNPLNGFVVSEGYGWISGGCGWGCLWEDGKFITNGFHNVSGVYVRCEGNYPCPGEFMAYRPNENGGYSKMTCTDSSLSDCTTEQFDKKGKLIAEYDNDNQLINKYDYDNSGNLAGTYDDQCVLQSCSSGHLEKNGSCIPAATGCGAGYKQIENWCNHIQWTPAEAAAVLHDDNNNSVTITFRK